MSVPYEKLNLLSKLENALPLFRKWLDSQFTSGLSQNSTYPGKHQRVMPHRVGIPIQGRRHTLLT